ncbi:ferritin-like domain-containing protein [Natrinema sp. 74]|uniref:YciE/YciF ferroxidase family protein n=1 Tax=Natrinema sp. 74 TaxID=3384159 RepID=UPI0038D3771B
MIESDRDLFVRELRKLYHIERELEDLQSGLAEAATDEDLEDFFMGHSERTTEQIARLEPIFDGVGAEPTPLENAALEGLRTDREDLVEDLEDPVLGDLVETELGRGIERLEITKLETLLALADRMELPDEIVDPLEQTKTEAETGLERLRELTAV